MFWYCEKRESGENEENMATPEIKPDLELTPSSGLKTKKKLSDCP